MTHLSCSTCSQRYVTAATRRFPDCMLCGGTLREVEPPARPPSADQRRTLPTDLPPLPSAAPGTFAEHEDSYASLVDFGKARRRRIASAERDFGLGWTDGEKLYRAAWVAETGELYIVQLGAPDEGGGHVELLATDARVEDVERALSGWRLALQARRSLDWLRKRAARLRTAPPLAPAG
jgi:hypothetical protein